jgi:hypothetical protein
MGEGICGKSDDVARERRGGETGDDVLLKPAHVAPGNVVDDDHGEEKVDPRKQWKNHWPTAVEPPEAVIPVREVAAKSQELYKEGLQGGKLSLKVFLSRYADLWQAATLGFERAKLGKRQRKDKWHNTDPNDLSKGYWMAQYQPDERMALAYLQEIHSLLNSLAKFRKETREEQTGMPPEMLNEIVEALKDFPEAKQALLKKLEKVK